MSGYDVEIEVTDSSLPDQVSTFLERAEGVKLLKKSLMDSIMEREMELSRLHKAMWQGLRSTLDLDPAREYNIERTEDGRYFVTPLPQKETH